MKIALFHNLPSGGAKRHTFEQLKRLFRRGHTIVEYAPSTADLDYCSFEPFVESQRIYEAPEIDLQQRRIALVTPYIHASQIIAHLRETENLNERIARDIDRGRYDLVLAKDCHIISNPFILRFLTTKSVFQCHHGGRSFFDRRRKEKNNRKSTSTSLKKAYYLPANAFVARYLDQIERVDIRSATRILTNSKYSEGLLDELYGVQSDAIYPGIDIRMFVHQDIPEADYVLSVGALIPSKGHRFLVSVLALLDPARRPSLFIAANLINPVEEQLVKAMAEESGVDLHIENIKDNKRLVHVYNQAKVFIYAPYQEALGMAPLEALACGTPVVAVAEGGVHETIVDGEVGYLVERNEEQFAKSLQILLADERLREQMGRAGIDYVRRKWTWERAIDDLETHLEQV